MADAGRVVVTPLVESASLSAATGRRVVLKLDWRQKSGSFKYRGISACVREAAEAGCRTVVASSGGNAGLVVAVAAREFRLEALIFVPLSTSEFMVRKLQQEGAKTVQVGRHWAEANEAALLEVERLGPQQCRFCHPYAGPAKETLWNGHATIVDEIRQQLDVEPDAIVLSVGGGGLLMGVQRGLERAHWLDRVQVVACETYGADCLFQAVQAKQPVTLPAIVSVATSLGAVQVTPEALEWALAPNSRLKCVRVTDNQALDAVEMYASHEGGALVEPACGAALAALTAKPGVLDHVKGNCIVVIVCGGSNISEDLLKQYREKAYVPE